MGRTVYQTLFAAPEVNPVNHKAKSVPLLNPFNPYGRVFFFSWVGFLVAFMSWYAFPPLLTITIKADLGMTQAQVANSNIFALLSTFLVRFIAGPLCDQFGPRWVFIGVLLAGAIPTAMAGLVTTPNGLIALRFFVGILGASFVPCQVWCTAFFDLNVVGTANALAGGWGNAGGGITYFVMPALLDSLVHVQGLESHKAWRVAYIVPFIIITFVAMGMLFLCPDTPTGKWSERHLYAVGTDTETAYIVDGGNVATVPNTADKPPATPEADTSETKTSKQKDVDYETQLGEVIIYEDPKGEVIVAPTFREALRVFCCKHSLALALPYACSFGSELAINSILGAYYLQNFPTLGQTKSGQWAAMFGLLDVIFRPAGGFIADITYRRTDSVWAKKLWIVFLGVVMGVFEIAIGLSNPKNEATMFGLIAGLAFFMETSNGANFAVVPQVHPNHNGILSGMVGAFGNLGGVIFAIVFRYNGTQYGRSIWIIGAISVTVNLAVSWIAPVPKEGREKS